MGEERERWIDENFYLVPNGVVAVKEKLRKTILDTAAFPSKNFFKCAELQKISSRRCDPYSCRNFFLSHTIKSKKVGIFSRPSKHCPRRFSYFIVQFAPRNAPNHACGSWRSEYLCP